MNKAWLILVNQVAALLEHEKNPFGLHLHRKAIQKFYNIINVGFERRINNKEKNEFQENIAGSFYASSRS